MLREIERERWRTFLDEFSERNRLRDVRLQISGQIGSPWVERGLLLESVTLKLDGDGAPRAEFLFGGSRPLTRGIPFVRLVAHQPAAGGSDEILEIVSAGGARTLLFLSSRPDTTAA
jgi:hypothetical protein